MSINDYEEAILLWEKTEGMGLGESDSYDCIKSFLERNEKLSYVYIEGEKMIGAVLCGHDGRRGFLYHLAVDKMNRNRGVGSRLVETCLKNLKMQGIHKCHIFVMGTNETGKQFWDKSEWEYRNDLLIYSRKL
ncbi:MAG: GNAT family N-acetyltransferase [Clostridia bacterium]|nr:GNAT family N-acetyltransferase [Clostridia bacterium]